MRLRRSGLTVADYQIVREVSGRAEVGRYRRDPAALADAHQELGQLYAYQGRMAEAGGGSFGASPLAQHVGLGRARRIKAVEIFRPASRTRQVFSDVPLDRVIEIRELDKKPLAIRPN